MKFTFKKEPRETGLRSFGHPYPNTIIKLNKKKVGTIRAPSYMTKDGKWVIAFTHSVTPTEKYPCPFTWYEVSERFESETDAREYIKKNAQELLKMNFHHVDD